MLELTLNGKAPEICRWVVETYKHREDYKDNESVQQWIKLSEQQLLSYHLPKVP